MPTRELEQIAAALRQLADLPRRLASDGTTPGLRLQARLPLSRADVDPPS